jgi:hypothetical protein
VVCYRLVEVCLRMLDGVLGLALLVTQMLDVGLGQRVEATPRTSAPAVQATARRRRAVREESHR